jgi:hypothetical protein
MMMDAEVEGRIRSVWIDPDIPVDAAWDLGVSDSNAIWFFQRSAGEVHFVDYVEGTGKAMQYWAQWKQERGYNGFDYVPHDARQRSYTAMGKDGMAKQRIEVMIEAKLKPIVVPIHAVIDGISAARQVLPRCYFDEERCKQGIECLRQYQREWDDDHKVFKNAPLHNWASHGADAFRCFAMGYKQRPAPAEEPARERGEIQQPRLPKVLQEMTYDEFIATRTPRRDGHIS